MQVFLEHTAGATGEELEREMFILRKVIEKAKFAKLKQDGMSPLSDFYICTMSSKTICYKVSLNSHKGTAVIYCCLRAGHKFSNLVSLPKAVVILLLLSVPVHLLQPY